MENHWLERGLILGGWAGAGMLALIAVIGVFAGHGSQNDPAPRAVAQALRTPSSVVADAVASAQLAQTPAAPTPRPATSVATPQVVRSRCDELRASPNWSPNDREWFLANCLTGGTDAATSRGLAPTQYDRVDSPPDVPTPTAIAPTATRSAESVAAFAAHWLETSAPVSYNVEAGSCSALMVGEQWTATCQATLAGCSRASACERTIVLCISADLTSVTSFRHC